MKFIKIALLYWFNQALRVFCPHINTPEAMSHHRSVCPACGTRNRIRIRLEQLCGWKAISELRKCDLCWEPLSESEKDVGVHRACAEREQAKAEAEAA